MKAPRLAEDLAIDLARLVDTRVLVQANSGGGKSWCLRRLLEETHGAVQHLVIDPEGEFSSLRERFDYVLAASQGGETAAEPRTAALLAEKLLELNVSAILDLYELKAPQRVAFVKAFLEALVDAPKKLWHPALVVVDEAHVFCPEEGKAESAGAVIDLQSRGRKRGFCGVLATQRIAKLHKDAAAECNNKLIGRTGLDVDLQRACKELGFPASRWPELRNLDAGEFFVFGPALSREVRKHHIGPVVTTHPKAGARLAFTAPPPTEKIRALLPRLSDLPAEQERKAKTEADLRAEVRSLKAQLAARPVVKQPEPIEVKVNVLDAGQMELLEEMASGLEVTAQGVADVAKGIIAAIRSVRSAPPARATLPRQAAPPRAAAPRPAQRYIAAAGGGRRRLQPESNGHLSGPEQRVLDALAELEVLGVEQPERVQVAFLAGYGNLTSKGFANAMGSLSSAGRIVYPASGRLALTEDGRADAHVPDAIRTPEELQARVLGLLGGASGRLLRPLIDSYPEPIDRTTLAEAAGYGNVTSKGFANAIGRLRSLGFIDYPAPGQVVARPVLFLEER